MFWCSVSFHLVAWVWRQRFFETSVMTYNTEKDCSFRKSHKCVLYVIELVEQSSSRKRTWSRDFTHLWTEGSLPCSQKPATWLYCRAVEFIANHPLYFFKIHLTIYIHIYIYIFFFFIFSYVGRPSNPLASFVRVKVRLFVICFFFV